MAELSTEDRQRIGLGLMATQTFPHSSFSDGIVQVEIDINTAEN